MKRVKKIYRLTFTTILILVCLSIDSFSQCSITYNTPSVNCTGGGGVVTFNYNTPNAAFAIGAYFNIYSFESNTSSNAIDNVPNPFSVTFYLQQGMYILTVSDSLSCIVIDTLFSPGYLTGTDTLYPPSCAACNDGIDTVYPAGGVPPYTGYWMHNPSNTTTVASSLGLGVYQYVFTDFLGCTGIIPVIIDSNSLRLGLNYSEEKTDKTKSYFAPNPANTNTNFYYASHATGDILISIIDNTGREVYKQKLNKNLSSAQININRFNNGIYQYKTIFNDIILGYGTLVVLK